MSETRPIVYVVDDDASFPTAISWLLWANGFSAKTFSSAYEFLARHRIHSRSWGCETND
jgi:FixJ family two-component response regulator